VSRKITKAVGAEKHSLVASQIAQSLEKIYKMESEFGRQGERRKTLPCSAVGSRDALGSSNNRRPTLGSLVIVRMNVRALVKTPGHGVQTQHCRITRTPQAAASDHH
jgi:hypothetical protein